MDLDQVFEYAIDQESQAQDFYQHSAEQIDNAEAAALFRSLAKMEAAHKRALETERRVLQNLGEYPRPKQKRKSSEEEMVESLRHMAQVLREANVELTSKHKELQVEIEAAGRIQETLLPKKVPQLPGLAISVGCSMAERVGGDYFDFLFTPRGELAATIADVSGKGLPAAMLMMATRTLWRAKIREGYAPDRVLEGIAADAADEFQQSENYVTMISAAFDPAAKQVSFANAGHWPPLVCRTDDAGFLTTGSAFLPIGLGSDERYRLHQIDLDGPTIIVFFSDGILDAQSPETGERFGEDRLKEAIREARKLTVDEIRDAVSTAVFEFSRGRQYDDQTIVILKKA